MPLTMRSKPRLNGPQIAGAGDGAFGEDADHVAGGELLARGADGLHHAAAMGLIHRDGFDPCGRTNSALGES